MIDGHCHYSDERVFARASELILEAQTSGVQRFYLGGTHSTEWGRQAELAQRYPGAISQAYGLHPWWVERLDRAGVDQELDRLRAALGGAGPDALGETGLDFHSKRDPSKFALQEYAFTEQLKLAVQYRKPLVLHVVKAFERVFELLNQELGSKWSVPVLVHRYSGSAEQARLYLDQGAILSYSVELLDLDRAKKTRRAFEITPLDQLSLETDAPDLPSGLLPDLYRWAAEQRGMSVEQLIVQIRKNLDPFTFQDRNGSIQ